MKVYLLTHLYDQDDIDAFKIIGIFSSREKALDAVSTIKDQPGFRKYPDSFSIDSYEVDDFFWREGFG